MTPPARETVTAALSSPGRSGRDVVDAVIPLVYDELRRMARRQLAREHHRLTLDTSGLLAKVSTRPLKVFAPEASAFSNAFCGAKR